MDKYLDIVIGGIISLISVVCGFFLQLFSNHLSESKRVKEELAEITNSIYKNRLLNTRQLAGGMKTAFAVRRKGLKVSIML